MNSRERVLAAVNRLPVDRIPCDYEAQDLANKTLHNTFHTNGDYRALLLALGADIIDIRGVIDPVWKADFPKVKDLGNGETLDWLGFHKKRTMTQYGWFDEHTTGILSEAETVDEIENFNWPNADWFDFTDFSKRLSDYDDFAIMASGASVYQHPSFLRGNENLLCDYLMNQEMAHYITDKYTSFYLDYFERMFTAAKGKIALFRIADDMGTQLAPIFGLDVAKEFIFPNIKKLCDLAHSFNIKVMLHSCGSITQFFDDIINSGVDILDPLQPLAKDMDFVGVKRKIGNKICLHGAVDTQYLLPSGTKEEVRKTIYELLSFYKDESGLNGGFIISPAHVLQPDVPIQNILTMYQAIRDFNDWKVL